MLFFAGLLRNLKENIWVGKKLSFSFCVEENDLITNCDFLLSPIPFYLPVSDLFSVGGMEKRLLQ
jgi:hypothetical protein